VAGLATVGLTHSKYIPTWTEWVMTFGILSAAALFYLFCVERLRLFDDLGREHVREWITPEQFDHTDWKTLYFGAHRLGSLHLNSLIFVLAAAISFGLVPKDAVFGVSPEANPVRNPRRVQAAKENRENSTNLTVLIPNEEYDSLSHGSLATVMMLNGNRDDSYVLFDHEQHQSRAGGEQGCAVCHHMNKPFDRSTGCYQCHSDMYTTVDIFDHDFHTTSLGGNDHCADCHIAKHAPKVRENTKSCLACHQTMVASGSRVSVDPGQFRSRAVGYMDAMHGLCIDCHKETQKSTPNLSENFYRCGQCHRSLPALTEGVWVSSR
jgi:hypothetical protein